MQKLMHPSDMGGPGGADLKMRAVIALNESLSAMRALEVFAKRLAEPRAARLVDQDMLHQVQELNRLVLFLGAPGEMCETCNGSGRKP